MAKGKVKSTSSKANVTLIADNLRQQLSALKLQLEEISTTNLEKGLSNLLLKLKEIASSSDIAKDKIDRIKSSADKIINFDGGEIDNKINFFAKGIKDAISYLEEANEHTTGSKGFNKYLEEANRQIDFMVKRYIDGERKKLAAVESSTDKEKAIVDELIQKYRKVAEENTEVATTTEESAESAVTSETKKQKAIEKTIEELDYEIKLVEKLNNSFVGKYDNLANMLVKYPNPTNDKSIITHNKVARNLRYALGQDKAINEIGFAKELINNEDIIEDINRLKIPDSEGRKKAYLKDYDINDYTYNVFKDEIDKALEKQEIAREFFVKALSIDTDYTKAFSNAFGINSITSSSSPLKKIEKAFVNDFFKSLDLSSLYYKDDKYFDLSANSVSKDFLNSLDNLIPVPLHRPLFIDGKTGHTARERRNSARLKFEKEKIEELPFADMWDNTAKGYVPNDNVIEINPINDNEINSLFKLSDFIKQPNRFSIDVEGAKYAASLYGLGSPYNEAFRRYNLYTNNGDINSTGYKPNFTIGENFYLEDKSLKSVSTMNSNLKDSVNKGMDGINSSAKDLEANANKNSGFSSTTIKDSLSVVRRLFNDLSLSFRDLGNATRTISSVMYSAIHLVQALENVMSVSDEITAVGYRLSRYDTTGASQDTLLKSLFRNANNSRAGVGEYGTLTQRILATGVTNGSAEEAMRISSLISKSMILGGSTAQEQRSAQLQLSQALASNILGGDELRAIRENAIGFTEMLAKGLTRGYKQGVFTDSNFADVKIGDLKGLGKKQLLTTDVVVKAISLMEDEINADFGEMPELFSQSMNKLMNTFKQRLNEFNKEGKGLSRVVEMFQKLNNWIASDEGKVAIDRLLDVFDSFIKMLTDFAGFLGKILNNDIAKFIGIGAIKAIPWAIGLRAILGKTDLRGNERGGLLGQGGLLGIGLRLFGQRELGGGNPLASFFSVDKKTGEVAGGLIPTIAKIIFKESFKNIEKQAYLYDYLTKLNPTRFYDPQDIISNAKVAGIDVSSVFNGLYNVEKHKYSEILGGEILDRLKGGKVFSSFAGGESFKGLGGIFAGTGKTLATTGSTLNGTLGSLLAPLSAIAAAIGAGYLGYKTYKHFDKKAEDEDFNKFLNSLPSLSSYTYLTDENKEFLKQKAEILFHTQYDNTGFGGNLIRGKEYDELINNEYLRYASIFNKENYLKTIADNTGATAENTAGTLDITDEFINNMKDIRTRQYKANLMMGNENNNTYNVTVNYTGDVADFKDKVIVAMNEAAQQYQESRISGSF